MFQVAAVHTGADNGFACAVSDPNFNDCPLVYVSPGFDKLTGYSSDFSCGRSCRFLQPISAVVNDAFNLDERRKMREFCTTLQKPGTTIVNLLLNERYTGERFWNLLHMTYVEVEGELYILGVQTNLDAYMPKNIQKAQHEADQDTRVVAESKRFLEHLQLLRDEIGEMHAKRTSRRALALAVTI